MNTIQNTSSLKAISPSPPTQSIPDGRQSRVELPSSTNSLGFKISAEAQYIFEIDKYLIALGRTAREKTLHYLSSSDNNLQRKAAECFLKVQEKLGEERTIVVDTTGSEQAKKLLDIDLEINGATEIAVMPMAAAVFRLDGNDAFYPVRLNYRNDALKYQLDALEDTAHSGLGNQDAANLFGSVRNALSASENILLSFDDVLHFNYSIEKARTAVDFIDAPEGMVSALTELLNQSVAYQNDKQSRFLDDAKQLLNDSRVSQLASEDVRLGTAAQLYNTRLQRSLNATGQSLLNARESATALLAHHPDLIRFGPDKLDEAFEFYKLDFQAFERALNNEFHLPTESYKPELGGAVLDIGRDYAMKVIKEIEATVLAR